MPEAAPPSPSRILALGDIPPRGGVVETPVLAEVDAWLRAADTRPALWIHGPSGSGRTTALATAIRRSWDVPRHAKRIACFPGMCLEEILEEASDILRQVGSDALSRVLDQRSLLGSKVSILLRALNAHPLLLWIDDVDTLLPVPGALEGVLEGLKLIDGEAGRVVLTSQKPPPPAFAATFEVKSTDAHRCPFSEKLIERASRGLGDKQAAELAGLGRAEAVQRALETLVPQASTEAAAVLQAAAVLPPEPSRQALREVTSALGVELDFKSPDAASPLRELESLGLATIAPHSRPGESPGGPPATVPAPVRRFIAERLRRSSPDVWQALHAATGAYYLRIAGSISNVWHYVSAWREFLGAGLHDEAYEVQKVFLQDLIHRGCLDPARHILEETVRTSSGARRVVALGNLAILQKNAGDFAGALELYGKVRQEFIGLGDRANVARVLHQIGNTQYLMGDYAAASSSYERSLEISTELGHGSVAAATRIQIANVLFQCGKREEALEHYLGTLDDARVAMDHNLMAAVELQIGQIHLQERRYVEADSHLKEAETNARACGDLRSLVKVLEAQAMVARERREYDLARARYDEALRIAEALGDAIEAAASLILAGDVEKTRLQLADSLECYFKALRIVEGCSAGTDTRALRRKIADRVECLAEILGREAFERIERSGRLGQSPPG